MSVSSVIFLALLALVYGDVYLQEPSGSNNRFDEANRDRNNANRMFDSQNNNRGGYNVGSGKNVYFYEGSVTNFEWTNQHSCGTDGVNPTSNNCEVIIQYQCDPLIRDGTTGNTIQDAAGEDTNTQVGRHESYASYQLCKATERNKGLFTANQNVNGNDARYTRQNPNGARSALECPEERDYYPYWRPTPWVDLVIMTNQPERCPAYIAASQNNAANILGVCQVPEATITTQLNAGQRGFIPITKTACEAAGYTWATQRGKGVPDPKCVQTGFSRDNHLGNGLNSFGYPLGVNITIPSLAAGQARNNCVFRLRYNISTNDAEGTLGAKQAAGTTLFASNTAVGAGLLNASLSTTQKNPNANNDPAEVAIWTKYGLARTDVAASFAAATKANPVESREYVFKNNPKVAPFADQKTGGTGAFSLPRQTDGTMLKFQMAINTNQFGRTFQDRTHTLAIKPRPADIPLDAPIQNIQVSGKRGNIVQTFPGTEYKFSPDQVTIKEGDYVHFQWMGSNTNPQNNAGQGTAGTDRHNVVILSAPKFYEGQPVPPAAKFPTFGQLGASLPGTIQDNFLGLSLETKLSLATLVPPGQTGGPDPELNNAAAYYDAGAKQVSGLGNYNYMSTRNNNFSNRGQKATITVANFATSSAAIGIGGGTIAGSGGTSATFPPNALAAMTQCTILNLAPAQTANTFSGKAASDFVSLQPERLGLQEGAFVTMRVAYTTSPLSKAHLYGAFNANNEPTADPSGTWKEITSGVTFSNGKAVFNTAEGGVWVVETKKNWGAVAGIIIAVLVVVGVAGFLCAKRYRDKMAFENAKRTHAPLGTSV